MSEIHRLPDSRELRNEASSWLARLNADDVTPEDRAQFEAWRRAHPLNARTFDAMSGVWQRFLRAGHVVRAVSFGQAMHEAAQPRGALRRAKWAAAAVLAALAVGAWIFVQSYSRSHFETAIGEHAAVQLPDGSSLELNSHSIARMDYTPHSRIIHLERGEAYFKVAPDPRRPFWVVARNAWIRALGTAFNVDLRGTQVRVTVSEGTVQVAALRAAPATPSDRLLAQGPVSTLTAGEQADLREGTAALRALATLEVLRVEAWRQGKVFFIDQPLDEVIEELSRYTTLDITVTDEALRRLPVGGTFQTGPQGAEALLTLLQDGFEIVVRRDGNRVEISSP
jgi:transmembrane sensor